MNYATARAERLAEAVESFITAAAVVIVSSLIRPRLLRSVSVGPFRGMGGGVTRWFFAVV